MTSTREKIKTVLICLLLVGMVYLTYAVWFYDSPFGELHFGSLLDFSVQRQVGSGKDSDLDRFGIRPLAIVLTDNTSRRGAVNSSEKSDEMYFGIRGDIAQCVKRARAFEEADAVAWESALSGGGAFMDYRTSIPLSATWLWLGSPPPEGNIYGRYYIFSTEKRNVVIYVKSAPDGRIYRAQTDFSSETLKGTMSALTGESVSFAIEREEEDFRAIMDETVIPMSGRELPHLSTYNSVENFSTETMSAALEVFGLSDVVPTRYAEQDGTEVYIADRITLKISPAGTASYTDTREEADETLGIPVESEGEVPTLSEKVEAARKLTASLAAKLRGEGGIYIASISEGIDGTEIIFGRHVGGVPVDMRETLYFSSVLIKGKSIRSAKFNLFGYDKSAKLSACVPERIAAAAIKGAEKSGDINLRYRDAGEADVSFAWYIGGLEKEKSEEA